MLTRQTHTPRQLVAVIGAGLAGTACALALSRAGHRVSVFESADRPAQGASGNAVGILHPLVSLDYSLASQWFDQGMRATLTWLEEFGADMFAPCGVLQLAQTAEDAAAWHALPNRQKHAADWLTYWPADKVRSFLSSDHVHGALWSASGAWVKTRQWVERCEATAKKLGAEFVYGTEVGSVFSISPEQVVLEFTGQSSRTFDHVVVCAAAECEQLLPQSGLMLRSVRGGITTTAIDAPQALPCVVCAEGYATPAIDGEMTIGASYERIESEAEYNSASIAAGVRENLGRLREIAPRTAESLLARVAAAEGNLQPQERTIRGQSEWAGFQHRVSTRSATIDRLPVIGAVADLSKPLAPRVSQLHQMPRASRVWVLGGLGSRGLAIAPLGAEIISAMIGQTALPVNAQLARAVDPARFALRRHQRRAHAKLPT